MTSYQRVAALVLRLVGVIWTAFFAFIWSAYLLEMALGVQVQRYPWHTVIGNAAYAAFGLSLVVFSRPLAHLIARGLEASPSGDGSR
ncbi:hypothetical protein RKE25_20635 [Dyella sp. BiH032]|uniref:hypothetical protein n=1 Tax=Dyella sp. BiH032 TaxID=3075430 RepID=UPI002892CEE1|nr:hypothetical protein [Dyella sp. BiH032]WNL45789.1 hypothetical protein RKE25_20635 [Dyella sp. BiH032]